MACALDNINKIIDLSKETRILQPITNSIKKIEENWIYHCYYKLEKQEMKITNSTTK